MKKYRMMAALCVAFLLTISFSTVAYAGGGEATPEPTETPASEPIAAPNPFTPAGTGTVVDNATDEDGKEFFTIMTPNENVFYLVIDRQREQENVYFLNAVTEKDLLALAEQSEEPEEVTPTPPVTPEPTSEPIPEPTPEPKKSDNIGMMIFVALAVLVGGGAGYYFKIYRPKQEQAASADDDYSEYENDPYDEQEGDTPPWDTDESTGEDEE